MSDTIKQRTVSVEISTGTVAVRRMRWKAARDFLKRIAKQLSGIKELVTQTGPASIVDRLAGLSDAAIEILEGLVLNSTDLKKEEFDELDLVDVGKLTEAAINLNLDQELKNSWAGIGQRFAEFLPTIDVAAPMTSGEESTPTSSMPATTPST